MKTSMNNEKDNSKYFKTSDLSLATTLSLSYPIRGVDRTNPQRVKFIFEKTKGLEELIDAFWQDKVKVSPRLYHYQLRAMKVKLYGLGEEENE